MCFSPDGNGKPQRNKPIFSFGARATGRSSLRHNRKKGLRRRACNGQQEIASPFDFAQDDRIAINNGFVLEK